MNNMENTRKIKGKITILMLILMTVTSICGICSINFDHSYEVINQYGETVKMYGYGLYAHDTYFHAPIEVGTDMGILFCVVPLMLARYVCYLKKPSNKNALWMFGLSATTWYYAASIAFGTTYNVLHLVYIALFGATLFGTGYWFSKIDRKSMVSKCYRGEKVFLVLVGIALIVAWLPDIIPSLLSGQPLELIGVYTTEITYVLDMGMIAPLCFVILYLLKKKNPLGDVLVSFVYCIGLIISVMIILGTIMQYLSGLELPIPALATKVGSFLVLGAFALFFWRRRISAEE